MTVTTYCTHCGEIEDGNHPLCDAWLRLVRQGYCDRCDDDLAGEHDDCVLEAAAEERPSLLDPPTPGELAAWDRFFQLVRVETTRRTQWLAVVEQARWN